MADVYGLRETLERRVATLHERGLIPYSTLTEADVTCSFTPDGRPRISARPRKITP